MKIGSPEWWGRRSVSSLVLAGGLVLVIQCSAVAVQAGSGAERLASEGNGGSIPACDGCHGRLGEGNPALGSPRLAALPEAYLQRQLSAFADGARTNAIMTPVAKALSAQQMTGLAAFYAGSRLTRTLPYSGRSLKNDEGLRLATRGRWSDDLPACIQCHGGDGGGVGANFPPLVGQPASYLSNQLRAWQNDQRDPGPLGLMGAVAKNLSERDVAAVAGYFGSSTDDSTMPVPSAGPDRGAPPARSGMFLPPAESTIPDNEYGNMLRLGERVFDDPGQFASAYVGNELHCSSCHLDAGRKADSAPLWAAYVSYPAYREKNHRVMTFDERMQDCFRFSMNGRAPPLGSETLVALDTYAHWLATGAVVDPKLPGRGYPAVPVPDGQTIPTGQNIEHGRQIYVQQCALCHGIAGGGQTGVDGKAAFPALWGPKSFNWGAGMADISKAAGFVRANMPLSRPNTLNDLEAYDVATYIDSQERPQDPRFTESVAKTRTLFHDSPLSMYGRRVGEHVLGDPVAGQGTLRR